MFFVKCLVAIVLYGLPVIWAGDPSNLKLYFLVDNTQTGLNDVPYEELKTTGLIDLIPKVDSPFSNPQVMLSLMACNNNNPQLVLSNEPILSRNMLFHIRIFSKLDNLNCTRNDIEKGLFELNKIIDRRKDVKKLVVVFLRSNLLPQREEELKIQAQEAQQRGASLIFVDMRSNTGRLGNLRQPIFGSLSFGSPSQSSGKFLREFTWAQRDRVKAIINCEFELLQDQNSANC